MAKGRRVNTFRTLTIGGTRGSAVTAELEYTSVNEAYPDGSEDLTNCPLLRVVFAADVATKLEVRDSTSRSPVFTAMLPPSAEFIPDRGKTIGNFTFGASIETRERG